jgi:hypothetical protein
MLSCNVLNIVLLYAIMLSIFVLIFLMLGVVILCHCAVFSCGECRYVECCFVEFLGAKRISFLLAAYLSSTFSKTFYRNCKMLAPYDEVDHAISSWHCRAKVPQHHIVRKIFPKKFMNNNPAYQWKRINCKQTARW